MPQPKSRRPSTRKASKILTGPHAPVQKTPEKANTLSHQTAITHSTGSKAADTGRDVFFEYSMDMLCIVGLDCMFRRVSPSFERTLGWKEDELLSKPFVDFLHPDDRESTIKAIKAHELGKEAKGFENRYRCKDGSYKWISWNAHPLVDEGLIIGVGRDVTERKQTLEALRQSEERFRLAFDQSPIGAVLLDANDAHFVRTNGAFCRFTGYAEQELPQFTFRNITYPDDLPLSVEQARRVAAGEIDGFETEKRYVRKDGSIAWGHLSAQVVREGSGQILFGLAMIQDMTERKKAELSLRESQEAMKSLLNATDDVAGLMDIDGTIITANAVLGRRLGEDPDDLAGRNVSDLFPKELVRTRRLRAQTVVESGKPVRFEDASFDNRCFDSCLYPVFDARGKVARLAFYAKDITEAKLASQALAESQVRFKQFFDSVNDGISVRDATTYELIDANRRFCEMFGYTFEELKALPLGSLGVHESVDEGRRRLIALYAEVTEGASKLIQRENKRKDGSTFWVEVNTRRVTVGGREYLLAVARDITERKRAEDALKRSEEAALRLAQETGVIAEIGRIISSSLDIEEVYERFAEEVRKLIPFDRILVNLLNQQEGTLTTAYIAGMEVAGRNSGIAFPVARTVTEEMIRTGAPLLFQSESIKEAQHRFPGLIFSFQAGVRSRLSVLLIARGEVIGSLTLCSKQEKAYGERDIRLAQGVASQIAGAIANARLFRERRTAEETLRHSQQLLERTFASLHAAVFTLDAESARILQCNPAASRIFGYSPEELLGSTTEFLHVDKEALEEFRKHLHVAIQAKGSLQDFRFRMKRRDGTIFPTEHSLVPLEDNNGQRLGWVSVVMDITDREQAEEKIKASLREKEVLLKEIHHRVKNNLQIISSLLYLQSSRTEHPGAVSALRESRARIKSMALIHERLYASPDLASVDMGKYTTDLVSDLRHSHMPEDGLIRLTLNIEDILLGITEAIPCGLIINELVSNALKHAFPHGREGEITIQLQRAGAKQIALTVSDNGVGFPEYVDFRKSSSLGLTLIKSLVEQLDGAIELDSREGTAFTVTFG